MGFPNKFLNAWWKMAEIRPGRELARSMHFLPHRRRTVRRSSSGTKTMTFNLANLQNVAISFVGAIVAASLFISAAIGPVRIPRPGTSAIAPPVMHKTAVQFSESADALGVRTVPEFMFQASQMDAPANARFRVARHQI